MTNGDSTARPDPTGPEDSSSARRRAEPGREEDSTARGGQATASSATDPGHSDQTVISTAPPLPLEPGARGMRPRDLGQALEGQKLDHVLLEQFVGGGGMGAVFRAWDTNLHRTVAVKVLSTYQAGNAESQRRFQTEARSAARLDHPNIARVHYVGEDRGVRYIVFEYIDGTNVRDIVHSSGPLPLADALNFTLQLANALIHAWQREVVHRDIKPSNILITGDGLAKLVDMGLARLEEMEQPDDEMTATGVTLGTFDYISPEQARDPRSADIRSDIYSLGCTLYFMLTGQPPFPDGTPVQKLLQHQSETPPDLRQFRADIPESVVETLEMMLAKQPEDRFQEPGALVSALVACTDELGFAHPQFAPPAYWARWRIRPTGWRRHAPWLVPLVLLVIGVAGLQLLVWPREEAPPPFPELQLPAAEASVEPAAEPSALSDQAGEVPRRDTPLLPVE